jgi:hypothetical protein
MKSFFFQLVIGVIQNRSQKEKLFNLEKDSIGGILLNSFFIVNSICVCAPLPKKIEYSILFHGSGTIEKTDPVFLRMLILMLPIIVLIHPHMFFSYQKERKKKERPFLVLGMKFCPRPLS